MLFRRSSRRGARYCRPGWRWRTELARIIYGADRRLSGTVEVNGQKMEIRSSSGAIQAGILYLTEDRKRLGLFLEMSVSENINLGVVGKDASLGGFLNLGRARQRAAASVKNLSIRTPSINSSVGGLSGGNQQKALLARLLELKPRVLFLDEPTRGIDIGAKSAEAKILRRPMLVSSFQALGMLPILILLALIFQFCSG